MNASLQLQLVPYQKGSIVCKKRKHDFSIDISSGLKSETFPSILVMHQPIGLLHITQLWLQTQPWAGSFTIEFVENQVKVAISQGKILIYHPAGEAEKVVASQIGMAFETILQVAKACIPFVQAGHISGRLHLEQEVRFVQQAERPRRTN